MLWLISCGLYVVTAPPRGDPDFSIAPGTPFEAIPDD